MEFLDKTGLSYFWGKIKPKFYTKTINPVPNTVNTSTDLTKTAVLGESGENFEKGLYMITYDVFLFSAGESGNVCSVALDGNYGQRSTPHELVSPMFGDLAFGINVSYTDFISLSVPSKIRIVAYGESGECTLKLGSATGEGASPTIIKLR